MSSALENLQFRPFETGFPQWDDPEPPVVFDRQPSREPVSSNSGSYKTNSIHMLKSNRKNSKIMISDERKQRRKISNRESARRSRLRKQNHLENLTKQLNRLRIANRELTSRLMSAVHQNQLNCWEKEQLWSEAVVLRKRLWDVRQVMVVRQHLSPSAWSCNNVTSVNGQSQQYSLIT